MNFTFLPIFSRLPSAFSSMVVRPPAMLRVARRRQALR